MRAGGHDPPSAHLAVTTLTLVVGAAVLVLSALPVDTTRVSDPEADVFRALNGAPDVPFALVWLPMQLGNVVVVPLSAAAALAARRPRLAAGLMSCGMSAWVLGKVVKEFVERGRPAELLDEVVLRGAPAAGLGFVSGHVAVVVAVTTVAWPWLGRPWRVAALALTALVAALRIYVGAHLPLDVVGGAGLGLAAGSAVNLVAFRSRRGDQDRAGYREA